MAGVHNEQAVSVIVGTLLLILITVIAAAGLALMVSQMQKDEMNRQSHLAAVKSEKIEITGVTLESRPSEWDGFFPPTNTTSNQSYSSVTFSLTNLNTDEARVIGIAINDVYPHNFTAITDSSTPQYTPYNFSSHEPSSYVVIPASGRKKIRINLTNDFFSLPQHIQQNDQITIRVMTSMFNTFEKTFKPPVPQVQIKMETDDFGTVTRDTLVLDGSQSTADTMIKSWEWTIYDLDKSVPQGNWDDVANRSLIPPMNKSNKIVRLNLPNNTAYYKATLTVKDDMGMSATSEHIDLPQGEFNPPSYLKITQDNIVNSSSPTTSKLHVTVTDMAQKSLPNIPVTIIIKNDPNTMVPDCFSLDSTAQNTDSSGTITVNIKQNWTPCGAVTVYAQTGKLISKDKIIPGVDVLGIPI